MTTKNKSIAEVVPQFRINQQKGSALHVCGACGAQIEQPMPARGKLNHQWEEGWPMVAS